MSDIDPAFGHWLAGFVDGEGCFDISSRSGYDGSTRYSVRFTLLVRVDDRAIIDLIHTTTGIGSVRVKRSKPGPFKRQDQYGWFVQTKRGVLGLVELFDRFPLRSKKARDYAIWREAALLYGNTVYTYKLGSRGRAMHDCWDELGAMKAQLMTVRRFA